MPPPFSRLYAVADATVCRARALDVVDVGRAFLQAGVRLLQLRAKDADGVDAVAWCDAIVATGRTTDATIIVNDRVDWCALSGATGVHVGQDDLPVEACRRLLGPAAVIGISTHTREQIDAALDTPASYLAVGPVFGTATKATGYDPVGLPLVEYAVRRSTMPVVAIGGITLDRVRAVIESGATSAVVITDLLVGGDPGRRAEQFLDVLGESARG